MKNSTYFDFRQQQPQGLLGGYNMQPDEDQWMSNNPIFNPQQQQPQFNQGIGSNDAWGQPNMQPIENQWMGNNPLADQMNKTAPAMDMQQQPARGGVDEKTRPDALMNAMNMIGKQQGLSNSCHNNPTRSNQCMGY